MFPAMPSFVWTALMYNNISKNVIYLVLTTMFLGVSGELPTTSYVKMVEVWLLFTLMVPFISVLLHIYIDSLRVSSYA